MTSLPRQKYGEAEKNTPEYYAWVEMRRRCEDPNRHGYENYGGRGIQVCERWHYYPNFLLDMGRRPGKKYSIDRINNDGNYEPSNCRWTTVKVQGNNRRTNHHLTAFGKTQSIQEWCDEYGIADTTFHNRLRRGLSVEDALTIPIQKQYSNRFRHKLDK